MKTFGFFLNGEILLKTIKCSNLKSAKAKLNFFYPINFNIEIKELNWSIIAEIIRRFRFV